MILHHDVWLEATRHFETGWCPQKLLSHELKRAAGVNWRGLADNEMPAHIPPDFQIVWVLLRKKSEPGRLLIPP